MNQETETLLSEPEKPRQGLALASLILGILAVCLSLFLVGGVIGIIGLGLGIAHLLKKPARVATAWWGVGLSVLGLVFSIGLGVVYLKFFAEVKKSMASMQQGANPVERWQGVMVPPITVTTLDGKTIRLEDLKGKRVVLDFWATWCGPCVQEIPYFVRLHNETPRDQLIIVGISDEPTETLKSFVKKKSVNYPIASAKDLPEPFKSIQAIPTTFFIDRNGVIQSIRVGEREYPEIRDLALGKDYEGQPKPEPPPAVVAPGLKDSANMLQVVTNWSVNLPGAATMCAGDWDGEGVPEILVADGKKLHALGLDGIEKSTTALPSAFNCIECGRHRQQGARLLGYSSWGRSVEVLDHKGKTLWSYSAMLGVDGAHWGDLDGDGTDELIVGMNGFGGLDALSADGKKLWHASLGNVWGQAIVSADAGRSALVFATEAGGTVRVFDGRGRAIGTLRPENAYYTKLAAAPQDSSGKVQVLALGQNHGITSGEAISFDSDGQVAWSSPVSSSGNWTQVRFASGKILPDGTLAWAFLDSAGNAVVASAAGEKLASIPGQAGTTELLIVPDKTGHGLLVLLRGGLVQGYSFK